MATNMTYTFILALLAIVVIGYLMKTATKLAVVLIAMFVLFGAGFIWGPDDMNEKLGLTNMLKPEYSTKVNSFMESFEKKREENGVVDQKKLEETYNQTQQAVKTEAQNWFTLAKDKFIEWFGFAKKQATEELTTLQNQIQSEIQNAIKQKVDEAVDNIDTTTTDSSTNNTN